MNVSFRFAVHSSWQQPFFIFIFSSSLANVLIYHIICIYFFASSITKLQPYYGNYTCIYRCNITIFGWSEIDFLPSSHSKWENCTTTKKETREAESKSTSTTNNINNNAVKAYSVPRIQYTVNCLVYYTHLSIKRLSSHRVDIAMLRSNSI